MEKISDLSKRLSEAMKNKNVEAKDLEKMTGISKSLIYKYIRDESHPRNDKVMKLAKVLGVNEVWLLGYDCSSDIITLERIKKRDEIDLMLNRMNDEELNKLLLFIKNFINEK